jgi:hypothetical protein
MNRPNRTKKPEENRIRPIFVALLVFLVAAILVPIWFVANKQTTPASEEAAATPAPDVAAATPEPDAAVPPAATRGYRPAMANAGVPPLSMQHLTPPPRRTAAARREKVIQTVSAPPPANTGSTLEERWGIQVNGISLSMGNAMLDMRYKVVNLEKAAALTDGKTRAFVYDPETGTTLFMPAPPKEGAFPPGGNRLVAGKTYFAAIANEHGAVKSGSSVSFVIGDAVLTNISIK